MNKLGAASINACGGGESEQHDRPWHREKAPQMILCNMPENMGVIFNTRYYKHP